MNRSSLLVTAVTLSSLLTVGCQKETTYIDSQGTDTIVNVDRINIQDWSMAADDMIQSLLSSGVLERAPQQPAVMAISRIVNDTTQQVDTDLLTKKIRVALNRSGKVLTTTTVGLGGRAEDPLAKSAKQMDDFYNDRNEAPATPYYTLSGKLLEDRVKAGNLRQSTFVFQLSLTQVSNGLAVWEEEKMITKQGSKPAAGW